MARKVHRAKSFSYDLPADWRPYAVPPDQVRNAKATKAKRVRVTYNFLRRCDGLDFRVADSVGVTGPPRQRNAHKNEARFTSTPPTSNFRPASRVANRYEETGAGMPRMPAKRSAV